MANVTNYKTLDIAIGDTILDSITPGNVSGYEVITNVTGAFDSTTDRYVYTITTASHTLYGDYASLTINSEGTNSSGSKTRFRSWVLGQNTTVAL